MDTETGWWCRGQTGRGRRATGMQSQALAQGGNESHDCISELKTGVGANVYV